MPNDSQQPTAPPGSLQQPGSVGWYWHSPEGTNVWLPAATFFIDGKLHCRLWQSNNKPEVSRVPGRWGAEIHPPNNKLSHAAEPETHHD